MNDDVINDLREAVRSYRFHKPSCSTSQNDPCTVGELNTLLESTAKIFDAIIEALDR